METMTQEKPTSPRSDDGLETSVGELRTEVRVRFEGVDKRFDGIDKRFEEIRADIRELRGDANKLKYVLLWMSIGIVGTMITVMAQLITDLA